MDNVAVQTIYLKDQELLNAQQKTVEYLLSFDANRFLFEIYKVAGLPPLTDSGYQGWERSNQINFRGHFFGHYLTALSQVILECHDIKVQNELHHQLTNAINGLSQAQAHYDGNPGYVSAFREIALDEVEGYQIDMNQRENVLVPWYNLDKILSGLVSTYNNISQIDHELAKKGLEVANEFGLYVYDRMQRLPSQQSLLNIEYGAMNATLYDLFRATKDYRHFEAATFFDEVELFESLAKGDDVLAGKHANTTLPKLLGALKHYQAVNDILSRPEEFPEMPKELLANNHMYLTAAIKFWDIVVEHHTYVTGGNSQSEHFHEADQLYHDAEHRNGDCTCETCNTYNMLRLSRELFKETLDKRYLDFYERIYINAILASQNPKTGMMMYFQPMGVGYNKVYNRPFDEFWCCTGTGIESFTKLSDSLYFYDSQSNKLLLNLYFSNEIHLMDHNLNINVDVNRTTGSVLLKATQFDMSKHVEKINIELRLPTWSNEKQVKFNGELKTIDEKDYANFRLTTGDVVELILPYDLAIVPANDNPEYIAFTYGPYVLSSRLGTNNLDAYNPNGILVRVGTQDTNYSDSLTPIYELDSNEHFSERYRVKPSQDRLFEVTFDHLEENLLFAPYYQAHNERYGLYYKLFSSSDAERNVSDSNVLGELNLFDGNNSEYGLSLKQHKSEVGTYNNLTYRQANPGGAFGYMFDLNDAKGVLNIRLTFHQSDADKLMNYSIKADEVIEGKIEVNYLTSSGPWYIVNIEVDVLQTDSLQLSFSSNAQSPSARLFGIKILKSV